MVFSTSSSQNKWWWKLNLTWWLSQCLPIEYRFKSTRTGSNPRPQLTAGLTNWTWPNIYLMWENGLNLNPACKAGALQWANAPRLYWWPVGGIETPFPRERRFLNRLTNGPMVTSPRIELDTMIKSHCPTTELVSHIWEIKAHIYTLHAKSICQQISLFLIHYFTYFMRKSMQNYYITTSKILHRNLFFLFVFFVILGTALPMTASILELFPLRHLLYTSFSLKFQIFHLLWLCWNKIYIRHHIKEYS